MNERYFSQKTRLNTFLHARAHRPKIPALEDSLVLRDLLINYEVDRGGRPLSFVEIPIECCARNDLLSEGATRPGEPLI